MIRRKCKSRRGETLIEALISLLVASLALTMLAGMIFKSKQLFEKSRVEMDAYAKRIDSLNRPTRKEGNPTVTISVVSGGAVSTPIPVLYEIDDTNASAPIISYVKSGA